MAEPDPLATGLQLTRWLFLRLLGLVYAIAFGSLAVQVAGLIGPRGLEPAGSYLDWARSIYGGSAYRQLPTIFWLGAGDSALRLVAWVGVALGILVIAGVATRAALVGAWLLYLSLSVAGQDFLSFQWDALLLETGVLAVLWAPPGWRPRRELPPPSVLGRWLLVFLLFKLMFLSGATKLLSGDPTWRHLTALDYHFETQPLPTWVGWYAHQLPPGVHRAQTAIMFAIELGAPWLLFVPDRLRALRYAGVAALVLLQAGIALTGNYGFFNLLAVVLCVPALDDRVLGRLIPRRLGSRAPGPPWRHAVVVGLGCLIGLLSALSGWAELGYTSAAAGGSAMVPRWGATLLDWVAPLRSFNGYGLFRVMTTERPEIIMEASVDSTHWLPWDLRYKPGPVNRAPAFVEPYHPRLDWQLWFAALDPMRGLPLLESLSRGLRAGTPAVAALVGPDPFHGAPPRFIRFAFYDYRFTTWSERRKTGAWWVRELRGYVPEPSR
ncbi:MAG TPA: lipase maturation factor family protein [Gemmatimonadales bacterium]|nr:lipase maturation factor family protein [Gemmatimonadales bacterium]